MTPLPAPKTLEAYFLEARSKILDLAAILDRVGRGAEAGKIGNDPRLRKIAEALTVLEDGSGGRAEHVQKVFSLEYDPAWPKPAPRY